MGPAWGPRHSQVRQEGEREAPLDQRPGAVPGLPVPTSPPLGPRPPVSRAIRPPSRAGSRAGPAQQPAVQLTAQPDVLCALRHRLSVPSQVEGSRDHGVGGAESGGQGGRGGVPVMPTPGRVGAVATHRAGRAWTRLRRGTPCRPPYEGSSSLSQRAAQYRAATCARPYSEPGDWKGSTTGYRGRRARPARRPARRPPCGEASGWSGGAGLRLPHRPSEASGVNVWPDTVTLTQDLSPCL